MPLVIPVLTRGYVIQAVGTSDTGSVTTVETNYAGLSSITFSLPDSRRLFILVDVTFFSSVAGDEVRTQLYDGATSLRSRYVTVPVAGRSTPATFFYSAVFAAGSHTLKVTGYRTVGTGNVTLQANTNPVIVTDLSAT